MSIWAALFGDPKPYPVVVPTMWVSSKAQPTPHAYEIVPGVLRYDRRGLPVYRVKAKSRPITA